MSVRLIQEIPISQYFEQVYRIMLEAYTIESQLLGVDDFYPLSRTAQDIAHSTNQFLGCFKDNELMGVCELEKLSENDLLIASTIVKPKGFRQGIASSLIEYVLNNSTASRVMVSTAENNFPAINLYLKHGFVFYDKETLSDGMNLVKLSYNYVS